MFQYTNTTFTTPIILLEYFRIKNIFFIFLVALTKKKCAPSEVSPHKIGPNWPIRQAETTVPPKLAPHSQLLDPPDVLLSP